MAAHLPPPRVLDFPFPSLPLSHTQDFSDYYTHPSILFNPHQLLHFIHHEPTPHPDGDGDGDGDAGYEYWISEDGDMVSEAEADHEDTVLSTTEAGIEDWMLAAEAGDEDMMIDYDADEEGFAATPAERDEGLPAEVVAGFLNTAACEKKVAAGGVCAVCLDDMYEEDRTVRVLGCGHGFHDRCIGEWLRQKNTCPLCRAIAL